MPEPTTQLTDTEVDAIEKRLNIEYEHDIAPHNRMLADLRALIRDLRALRAENEVRLCASCSELANAAATRMRELCVKKVKDEIRQQADEWFKRVSPLYGGKDRVTALELDDGMKRLALRLEDAMRSINLDGEQKK